MLWDSHGTLNVDGNLPTDRPHVVKLYGGYTLPWGTQVGGFFYGASGTPLSTYVVTTNGTYLFVEGRGDMGRTDPLYRTDMLLSQEFKLGSTNKIRLELNVLNLFNQQTSRHRFNWLNRGGGVNRASSAIDLTQHRPVAGVRLPGTDRGHRRRPRRLRPAVRDGRPLQPRARRGTSR